MLLASTLKLPWTLPGRCSAARAVALQILDRRDPQRLPTRLLPTTTPEHGI